MNTRRSFFESVAALSALSALLEEEGLAQETDHKVSQFWDAYFDEATRPLTQASRGSTDQNLLDPSKKVQLIQVTDNGLRYPDTIPTSDLSTETDVAVTVNPGNFRPSPDDLRAIHKSKGSHIRMDWAQSQPIMNLFAPMMWSGLAAWSVQQTTYSPGTAKNADGQTVKTNKVTSPALPDGLKPLDFRDPNDPEAPAHNQVVLPGGSGKLALNVSAVSVNQKLQTVLSKSVNYASIVAPFFGFAPVAVPALKVLTTLVGAIFNHEAVVMNSLPMTIVATQGAQSGPHPTDAVKIVSGNFIAVPTNQTSYLKSSFDKLRYSSGWLVHQDSKTNTTPQDRAQDPNVPPVSYMSFNLTVQSLADAQKQKAKGGS